MKKTQKAELINKYLEKSELAQKKEAQAIILEDGRLEYQMLSKNGKYKVKATLMEILNTLDGKEIRELYSLI